VAELVERDDEEAAADGNGRVERDPPRPPAHGRDDPDDPGNGKRSDQDVGDVDVARPKPEVVYGPDAEDLQVAQWMGQIAERAACRDFSLRHVGERTRRRERRDRQEQPERDQRPDESDGSPRTPGRDEQHDEDDERRKPDRRGRAQAREHRGAADCEREYLARMFYLADAEGAERGNECEQRGDCDLLDPAPVGIAVEEGGLGAENCDDRAQRPTTDQAGGERVDREREQRRRERRAAAGKARLRPCP
jgi:hypothetical protein